MEMTSRFVSQTIYSTECTPSWQTSSTLNANDIFLEGAINKKVIGFLGR